MRTRALAGAAIVVAAIAVLLLPSADPTPARAGGLAPPVIPEPGGSGETCPKEPTTTPQLVACLEKRLGTLDKRIDQLNATLFAELPAAPMKRKFIAGHRAWLHYRHADCIGFAAIYEEGTIFPVIVFECSIKRDKERIADLRALRYRLHHP